ncbi:MAG: hypothetical protein V7782_08855 [Psychromonas sp.]
MLKSKCYWVLVSISLMLLLGGNLVHATPVAWDQRGEIWLSQDSQHFTISYLEANQETAQRALDIAERVHSELLPFFTYSPNARTEIVLVDDYDTSNGWATPIPFAQIRLYMRQPEDVDNLEANDEWLHLLIRHEYAHTMQMELSSGVVTNLRYVFGRNLFLFPHVLTPPVFKEGLAVYLETDKALGYGRLQSSNYAMQMRMEVLSKGLKDLQQAVVATRELPFGYYYLYGAYFIEYLSETYGDEKLQLFLQDYSGKLLPYFLLNSSAEKAFNKDFLVLWSDYQVYLNKRFSEQIDGNKIAQTNVVNLDKSIYLQATASGSLGLLLNRSNGEDRSSINRLDKPLQNKAAWKQISKSKNITAMSEHPDAGIAVSRKMYYADGHVLNDVFLYKNENWQRLTTRQRFTKLRWLPNGKQLIASRKVNGISELWIISTQANKPQKLLWQGATNVVLGGFDISANGQYLVASVKRPQQGWNLERFIIDTTATNQVSWEALTDTKAIENAPAFLPDGRIIFSADYDGIYNIFVLDPSIKQIKQWTQEVGGAFQPHWQADLGLVYQAYQSDGYVLRSIKKPHTLSSFATSSKQGRYDYPDAVQQVTAKSEPEPYSAWSTLRPRTWLPFLWFDDVSSRVGAIFSGSDALGRHNYQIAADWDFDNSVGNYNLAYQYDNRWQLNFKRGHNFEKFSENGQQDYRITEDDNITIQRRNMFAMWEDNLRFHVGTVWDTESLVSQPDFSNVGEFQTYDEVLAGVALTFDNRQYYLNVPGVGWGNYVDLVVETNELFNSDYSGQKYQGQWLGTLDLFGRSTITARLGFGYADQDAKEFRLGGHETAEEWTLFGRDRQVLRGYPQSVQRGQYYATQRLEANTWLARVERNWGLYPIGLGDLSAKVFVDSGAAWDSGEDPKQLIGIGTELTAELKLGYSLTIPTSLGIAQGLDSEQGEFTWYLNFPIAF